MPEYSHTLIPDRVDFAPKPEQVRAFLDSLVSLGAAPLKPNVAVAKLSGEGRSVVNPFTGKTEKFPMWKIVKVTDNASIPKTLRGLDDYSVRLSGKGPPKLPPFEFELKIKYDFLVHCSLRAEVVSTSDCHDEFAFKRKVAFFGQPCSAKDRLGVFHNPKTGKVIEVPKAGCARFWVEFEFGKMLFPDIENRLDIIEPSILEVAEKEFGITFVQGCHWGA
jgi:hypothetical protein